MNLSSPALQLPKMQKLGMLVLLLLLLSLFPLAGKAADQEVHIGVLAKRGGGHSLQKWQATADYLNQEIPGYHFSIIPLSFNFISSAVVAGEIDFILANPTFYVELEARYGVNRIATLRNRVGDTITSQFGGVIFSRTDRADINVLEDLKERSFMAVEEDSLGGYHMAWGELQRHNIDPNRDFSRLEFGGTHDAVVYAVIKGKVDVGTVRTDTLERMAQEGKIDLRDIKVIHQRPAKGGAEFPFLHSTQLYPEWPFASLATTPTELAQTVAVALMRMPPMSEAAQDAKSAGWGVPLNYQPVHELHKRLKVGIYRDYGKISPIDVLRLYWYWFLIGLIALIAMFTVTTVVSKLNRRLRHSTLAIQEARDHLELRVQQRTSELEQANQELHDLLNEHRQTLDHLQRASRDRRLLLDSAGEGIYGIDSDGRVSFANAFTVNRLGWSEQELIGNNIHLLSHHTRANGEPYPAAECPVHATLRQRTAFNISDEIFWCKDGSSFPVEYTSTPIIEDGVQKGVVVVFRDISKRKLTEEALRRTQKMDALGKLTGGIAHDFNNMLGVILGYSDLLLRKLSDDPKLENYAAQILRAGERAKILTAKLLAFSRAETARAVPTDINQLLLDGRHMLEKTLTPRIVLILELADEIWPVWLDHAGLEDAILNMSINAMHAIAENGTLTLATCNVHLEEAEQLQMNIKSGDYVLMTITDSGSGMDQETRQRIFDPFFSTKGELGTGLGMSQVYGFVQQFGGDIHIDSEPGRGTSIAIYLPRYLQTDHLPAAADELVEEQHPTGHETILVVDDEAALCELASEILIAYGYRVFSADSGKLALEILAREPIDLLLSDVIMPGMDGYQLAEVVVRDYPQVKIQMVSGFSDNQHQGVSTNVKLHQHRLRKPYSTELLLQQIRARLDESELSSELELIQPIEWSEEIGTGIGAVDADHQILLSLFNRCVDLVSGNAQNDEVGAILGELMDYADYHFRREEVIMRECGYPELQSHKQAHQQLLDDAMQRVKAFGLGELSVTALLQFCHRWLTDHVINTEQDRDFISHCRGKDSLISQALRESQK